LIIVAFLLLSWATFAEGDEAGKSKGGGGYGGSDEEEEGERFLED